MHELWLCMNYVVMVSIWNILSLINSVFCCWIIFEFVTGEPNTMAKLVHPIIYCTVTATMTSPWPLSQFWSSITATWRQCVLLQWPFSITGNMMSMCVTVVAIFNNEHHDVAAITENRSSITVMLMSGRPLLQIGTAIMGTFARYCKGVACNDRNVITAPLPVIAVAFCPLL